MSDLLNKMPEEETVSVPASRLKALLDQNEEMKRDLETWRKAGVKLVSLFGIYDEAEGKMKAQYVRSETNPDPESPMGAIIKSATSIMGLAARTQLPGRMGKQAEDQLIDKFSFFSELMPLIEKYGK